MTEREPKTMEVLVLMNSYSAEIEREDYEEYQRTGVVSEGMHAALVHALHSIDVEGLIDSVEPLNTFMVPLE